MSRGEQNEKARSRCEAEPEKMQVVGQELSEITIGRKATP